MHWRGLRFGLGDCDDRRKLDARCSMLAAGLQRPYNSSCPMHQVKAIYPGTFDPLTNGHLDLIQRGSKIFDELIVGILRNPEKDTLFTIGERKEVLLRMTKGFPNARIDTFDGLLVDYARSKGARAVLRG